MQPISSRRRVVVPASVQRVWSRYEPQVDEHDELVGITINRRYEVTGKLGHGGMATVYLALDLESKSEVAIKIIKELPRSSEGKSGTDSRFIREAKLAMSIEHPNVISVIEVDLYKDSLFCVMEYLQGSDLAKEFKENGKLTWSDFCPIMLQICNGVKAAHDREIIHRDLKPANIFLTTRDGEPIVKILDFGIAKSLEPDDDGRLTQTGVLVGSPAYCAPEQTTAEKRSDLYSLGVIMYEMLTGELPFTSTGTGLARILEIIGKHQKEAPKPPREIEVGIPEAVERIILKLMEKKPGDRYQSADELRAAIVATLGHDDTVSAIVDIPKVDAHATTMIAGPESIGYTKPKARTGMKVLAAAFLVVGVSLFRHEIADLLPKKEQPPIVASVPTAPVVAQPVKITLNIRTNPTDAQIYDESDKYSGEIGKNGFDLKLIEGEKVKVIIKKRGFIPETVTLTLNNGVVGVEGPGSKFMKLDGQNLEITLRMNWRNGPKKR